MAAEIYLGYPSNNIVDWIRNHAQPPVAPSPYFAYDSNRVITGLYQGSPNAYEEGTYIDYNDQEYAEEHDGEYPEKPYSGWTYGGSNVVENYATAIGDSAFNNSYYVMEGIPPSKAIAGSITFQNITSIGSSAFQYCGDLTSITMPNVMNIGSNAFQNCTGLTSVIMPNVTSIVGWAFSGCQTLTSMTIGSEIQVIGSSAFSTQGNPATLTIGKSITEVQAMGQTDYDFNTNTPYSEWGLPIGSTIVCTDDTITV